MSKKKMAGLIWWLLFQPSKARDFLPLPCVPDLIKVTHVYVGSCLERFSQTTIFT
jgi:hypothetical protein